jgi:aryl-alcohol dehydrogenase-like predicted oxidoreductase
MQYRKFGKSDVEVSEIGFGTWAMGGMWGALDDQLALKSLHQALDLGLNCIDTAYVYGNGHSEHLIGKVLKERKLRDQIFVTTKVPPKNYQWPAKEGSDVKEIFSGDWIREMTVKSLKNLDMDCVDLQQLHVWASNWQNKGDWLSELEKLKTEGKIKNIGISINDHEPNSALELVSSGVIDSVQVIYNLFDQTPSEKLLPLCQEHNVAVIVRVPFDEGGLTGTLSPTTQFTKKDWRRHYFKGNRLQETYDRAEKFHQFFDDTNKTLPHLALKFCLSHPAVTTVIPGMRRPKHVNANCAVSDGQLLPQDILEKIKELSWPRNFYPNWEEEAKDSADL